MSDTTSAPVDVVAAAARALGLGLSDGQIAMLHRYADLLVKWSAVYNLTAARESASVLGLHVVDCLSCVEALRRRLPKLVSILDVGSGAGLPGAVLAICQPALQVTCVDAVGKKAAFIRQVASELRLDNLSAMNSRVEDLQGSPYPAVVCRAFSSLPDFLALTRHLVAAGGQWLAMKSSVSSDELAVLTRQDMLFHVEPVPSSPGMDRRNLVWMWQASAHL